MKKILFGLAATLLLVILISFTSRDAAYTRYRVLQYSNASTLAVEIESAMKLGWEPTGGVSMNGGNYMQAMVK
jgi:hypothetical protein